MEFCPNCNFMVYTKLNENDSDNYQLTNYCKNCGWKGKSSSSDKCVYKRNYEKEFEADRIMRNKYTIFDNTLPRLSLNCVNENCITNYSFKGKHSLIVDNIPEHYTLTDIKHVFIDNADLIDDYKPLRVTSVVLILKESSNIQIIKDKYDNIQIEQQNLSVKDFDAPTPEVLYIKYDPNDMKYLYMCVNCSTSWQGNNDSLSLKYKTLF